MSILVDFRRNGLLFIIRLTLLDILLDETLADSLTCCLSLFGESGSGGAGGGGRSASSTDKMTSPTACWMDWLSGPRLLTVSSYRTGGAGDGCRVAFSS